MSRRQSQLSAAVPMVPHGQPKASEQVVCSVGCVVVYEQATDGVVHPASERQAEDQVLRCPIVKSAALEVALSQFIAQCLTALQCRVHTEA